MAITHAKLIRGTTRNVATPDQKTATRQYKLWYGASMTEAETYLAANLSGSIVDFEGDTLLLNSVDVVTDPGDNRVFHATLDYSTAPRVERLGVGDEQVSFDLDGRLTQTYVSPLTVNKYAVAGFTAPDFKGGINFDPATQTFSGCEIFEEAFSFTVSKVLANASITNAYIANLRDTAFRWNSILYKGQAPGEVLFIGASGAPRDELTYMVHHKFLGQKNKTGLQYGDISGITRQGFDLLWPLFMDVEDATAKFVTPRPHAVYIERLYTSANFQAALGLNN